MRRSCSRASFPRPRALTTNYIDLLLNAPSLEALLTDTAPPASLLHALLRHSMLLEYANAASRILFSNGTPRPVLFKDQELIDISRLRRRRGGFDGAKSSPASRASCDRKRQRPRLIKPWRQASAKFWSISKMSRTGLSKCPTSRIAPNPAWRAWSQRLGH